MNRTELIEASKEYFKKYPKVNLFFATSDGMFFTPENRNAGVDHANKQKTKLETISRKETEVSEPAKDEAPTDKWKNEDIKAYMSGKGIAFEEADTKKILLEKIEKFVSDSKPE